MARRPEEYLADILEGIDAIRLYTRNGKAAFLGNAMARDAVIARISQIGEAIKGAQGQGMDLEARAPEIPWTDIAGMRDVLSHHYWRIEPLALWTVAAKDLKPLAAAVRRIQTKDVRRFRRP